MTDGVVVRILGDDSDLRQTLNDSVKDVAKWGAAAAAAAAVGAVAITKSTASAAREIKNLSRLIGTSTTDFQKMAAGAKTVGIEQDKLADIFKDVNDKVGDFMQTGAGPLVDFFEQVAPKIGVTADEFKNLSGPEALQKYADGLEAANLSQAEMTFFMEAIASDAALLTPLLAKGGEGFKKLGDEAQRAGAILSTTDIEKLEQLNKKIIEGEQSFTAMGNKISSVLSPQLVGAINLLDTFGTDSEGLEEIVNEAFNGVVNAVGFAGNSLRGLEVIFQTLQAGASQSMSGILDIIGLFSDDFKDAADNMHKSTDEAWAKVKATLGEELPTDALKKWVAENEAAADLLAENTVTANELKNEAAIVQIDTELMAQSDKFNRLLEIETAYQEASKEGLDAFNQNNLNTVAEYAAASEALEEASSKRKLGLASSMFGNLSSLMDTENKKLFQVGKVAALSQAIIDGYSSVLSSYKQGTKIGGPIVGAAFAATAGIATAVQISKISSASYGGGGSSSGGMSGGAPAVPEQQQAAAPEQEQNRTIRIEGIDANQNFSGGQVLQLAENLVELQNDGFKLVI